MPFLDGPPLDPALRVTLHFHPDRLVAGVPLLQHLVEDGVYRSQFETGTSNGGLTAHRGGDRWRWEQRMFGGTYDEAPAAMRPKYGSLNHRRRPEGGSIRFGSAHLRLARHVVDRTTFCYPDSVFEPTAFGTAGRMGLIPIADGDTRDVLDDYIEAHVHGQVRLDRDVEAVVLDPSFRDTPIATLALPCPVEWHPGFALPVDELDQYADYRGAEIVEAGHAVAEGGWLNARIIGAAANAAATIPGHDPQTLKRLWHVTARYGR